MKLEIQFLPLSPNSLRGRPWGMKKRLAEEWKQRIRSAWIPERLAPERKRVVITLHHSRLYDMDNAYGSVKPILDALKHWGIIVDDSAEWLELSVGQSQCPHRLRHTTIEVS